jgi:hypothetical protein
VLLKVKNNTTKFIMKITQAVADARHIKRSEYNPCTEAFLDTRIPGSFPKENYSIIGPGVAQSDKQPVNLREPHGFNLGAAGLTEGLVNNLHLHFTSETFMCFSGGWRLRWGAQGEQGELQLAIGDIGCIPPWMFRGFTQTAPGHGMLMAVLGGDDTGGILWSPHILQAANATGLYLTEDNALIDQAAGETLPEGKQYLKPVPQSLINTLKPRTIDDMRAAVLRYDERVFAPALLDAQVDGHFSEIAPVIGFGLSQRNPSIHSEAVPKTVLPQGFTMEWLRIGAQQTVGPFKLDCKWVLMNYQGDIQVRFNLEQDASVSTHDWDTVSIQAGAWVTFHNNGQSPAEALVICPEDHRKRPQFAPHIVSAAQTAGFELDANDYICPAGITPSAMALKAMAKAI